MCENDTKGWHGSYSTAGRTSAEKYHMVIHKDSILAGKVKKKKVFDFFSKDDEFDKNNLNEEDQIDIFTLPPQNNLYKILQQQIYNKKLICKGNINEKIANDKYKYHLHHHKGDLTHLNEINSSFKGESKYWNQFEMRNIMCQPSATKYNPKMDYIWNRTIIGPKWEKLSSRKNDTVQSREASSSEKQGVRSNAFVSQGFNCNAKNIFINMKKQTQRGRFTTNHDVRLRTDKPFNATAINFRPKNQSKDIEHCNSILNTNGHYNIHTASNFNKATCDNTSPLNSDGNHISLTQKTKENQAYHSKTWTTFPKSKKTFSLSQRNKEPNRQSIPSMTVTNFNSLRAPDFSKVVSREQLNYISRDRRPIYPFITPNYSWIESRPLNIISYSKGHQKKKSSKIQPLHSTYFCDPDKINSFATTKHAPNFKTMQGRPNDESPLPSYMKKVFDRSAWYLTTDKTLQWNNYSNGKLSQDGNTFYPKKSFNKVLNMNLLKNEKYIDSVLGGVWEQAGKVTKVMEFYSKNLDDIEKEGTSSKFDGVTFKKIPPYVDVKEKEKEMFKIDFHKIDD